MVMRSSRDGAWLVGESNGAFALHDRYYMRNRIFCNPMSGWRPSHGGLRDPVPSMLKIVFRLVAIRYIIQIGGLV